MSENVELFEDLFLKGLSRSTQEELAAKTREAVGMAVDV